jgi:BolA protein
VSTDRTEQIRECLMAHFSATELLVKDQSHLHAGHAGAKDGRGHFDVTVVAEEFSGKTRLERHRMVYEVLSKLIESDIHALSIKAIAPSER